MIKNVDLFLLANFEKKTFDANLSTTTGLQVCIGKTRKFSLLFNYIVLLIWSFKNQFRLVNSSKTELTKDNCMLN